MSLRRRPCRCRSRRTAARADIAHKTLWAHALHGDARRQDWQAVGRLRRGAAHLAHAGFAGRAAPCVRLTSCRMCGCHGALGPPARRRPHRRPRTRMLRPSTTVSGHHEARGDDLAPLNVASKVLKKAGPDARPMIRSRRARIISAAERLARRMRPSEVRVTSLSMRPSTMA